jgi:hypothetical protein
MQSDATKGVSYAAVRLIETCTVSINFVPFPSEEEKAW